MTVDTVDMVNEVDETAIRDLVARRVSAMLAGDPHGLVEVLSEDVVGFTLAPPLARAAADMTDVDGMRAWLATFDGPVDYEVRDLDVTVGGDVAFCHSVNRLSATPMGGSEPFTLWFRQTLGLRKVGGEWRVAHQHDSTPFLMDGSFLAAVDLKPEA